LVFVLCTTELVVPVPEPESGVFVEEVTVVTVSSVATTVFLHGRV
jgi:hypothetical protein